MDDQKFQKKSEEALQSLFDALTEADFEADFNSGALTVDFEQPKTRFVVSPNSPVHQIWISANIKSFKLDWDEARQEFVLPATGQSLKQVMEEQIATLIGDEVEL